MNLTSRNDKEIISVSGNNNSVSGSARGNNSSASGNKSSARGNKKDALRKQKDVPRKQKDAPKMPNGVRIISKTGAVNNPRFSFCSFVVLKRRGGLSGPPFAFACVDTNAWE